MQIPAVSEDKNLSTFAVHICSPEINLYAKPALNAIGSPSQE